MSYVVKITPLSERQAIIAQRVDVTKEPDEVIHDFRDGTLNLKVILLPIDIPVYRMENCRAFSAQQTEIARGQHGEDFFRTGQEVTDAQQAQHQIMAKLAEKKKEGSVARIADVLEEEGQRESILITNAGVVVNGNRRLSAMRERRRGKDGSMQFTHVKCAVLPRDTTPDEIDNLEAALQARPQTKLEYDWIGDAHLIRRQVNKEGMNMKDVAAQLHRREADIENVLKALKEADLYLQKWLNKPGEYALVQDGQQLFGDIPKHLAKKNTNLRAASRAIAWSLYDNRDEISGRIYRLNSAFGKLAPKVLSSLEEQLDLKDAVDDSFDGEDITIDIPPGEETKDYTHIINALRDNSTKEDTVNALLEACESAIELDKGHKSSQAALKALTQISNKVSSISVNSAAKNTFSDMLKQIETIRNGLDKIEKAIETRKAGKGATGADVERG